MEARTAWFRETGEARPKEQLLIETMFCVYYLSKGSVVLTTCAPQFGPFRQELFSEAGSLRKCHQPARHLPAQVQRDPE